MALEGREVDNGGLKLSTCDRSTLRLLGCVMKIYECLFEMFLHKSALMVSSLEVGLRLEG
jgi:hypothetical protein